MQEAVDLEGIIKSQKKFFKEGKTKKVEFRLLMLEKLKNALYENESQIVSALEKDLGKSACETFLSEYYMCISDVNFAIKNLKRWTKPKRKKSGVLNILTKSYEVPLPRGISVVISTWNYPLYLAISPLVSSIAAGNCTILKLSELSVATSIVVANMIVEIFGENYIAVVQGNANVSEELLEQDCDFVFFTGSSQVGKKVLSKCAENLIPAVLELGGKNPCIVTADCNIKKAAKRIAWGKFLNAGQTCIAPDYVFVDKSVKDKLIEEIEVSIKKSYLPNPLNSIDYGKIISMKHFNRLIGLLGDGEIICGGHFDQDTKKIEPTLIHNICEDSKLLTDEIFGPILPIIEFDIIEDVIEKISQGEKPLSAYIFSSKKSIQRKIINEIDCGNMCINDTIMQIVPPNLSFGGVGSSGMGRSRGEEGFKAFSYFKSVMNRSHAIDVDLRYPPYNGKLSKIRRLCGKNKNID